MRRVGRLVLRGLRMELAGWLSLARLITRRPRVPAGATAFPYDEPVRAILITILSVSVVEVVAVDLIVHRWPAVRIPLLALGVWGVFFMLGLLAGYLTRPHAIGPAGLRIRYGGEVDLAVDWDAVDFVRSRKQTHEKARSLAVVEHDDGPVLRIVVGDHTNLELALLETTTFRLPSGPVTVRAIHFRANDPKAFLDACRPHLAPQGTGIHDPCGG